MNVATLYSQVALLGFEDSLESPTAFYHAANRAIYQVNLLRPHIAEHKIFRHNLKNLTKTCFLPTVREEDLAYEAEGARAYYFEAAGNGTLLIEKYAEGRWSLIDERPISSRDFAPYKGFIKADGKFTDERVRLRFAAHPDGDFIYFVRSVAIYARLYGATESDIPPMEEWTSYDIAALCADFLSLENPPMRTDSMMRTPCGYEIDGGTRILLPYEAEGEFRVLYRRKPTALTDEGAPEDDKTEIDLDEELCQILPLLTAAYVWAEDEPEKAQYYMNLYRERAAEIQSAPRVTGPVKITNESGW